MRKIRAFSLIELLVVIAIIAILAALLFPALSRAKTSAALAKCRSNEKQMGLALAMYVADFNVFPQWGYKPSARTKNSTFMWYDALALNLGTVKWGEAVFKCPGYSWKVAEDIGSSPGIIAGGGSYAYNRDGADPGSSPERFRCGLGGHAGYEPPRIIQTREADIISPSDMYALGDAPITQWPNRWIIGESSYMPAFFWPSKKLVKLQHKARFNMLLVDGHVETIKTNELFSLEPRYRKRWNNDNQAPGSPL